MARAAGAVALARGQPTQMPSDVEFLKMPSNLTRRQALVLPAGIALGSLAGRPAKAAEPVKIGLVAALSGQTAKTGRGITAGLPMAIDRNNGHGGGPARRMVRLGRT